jgi:hypothetical protein
MVVAKLALFESRASSTTTSGSSLAMMGRIRNGSGKACFAKKVEQAPNRMVRGKLDHYKSQVTRLWY